MVVSANPARTSFVSCSALNPCNNMTALVQPAAPRPASKTSARRSWGFSTRLRVRWGGGVGIGASPAVAALYAIIRGYRAKIAHTDPDRTLGRQQNRRLPKPLIRLERRPFRTFQAGPRDLPPTRW